MGIQVLRYLAHGSRLGPKPEFYLGVANRPKTGPELELTPDFGVWTDNCFFHVGPSCFLVLMDPFLSLTVTLPSNVI